MYLDPDALAAIDRAAFRAREPYPWVNPAGLLTDEGFGRLLESIPDIAGFEKVFGKPRKYGQRSHDRYVLEWRDGLELPDPWREFVDELRGETYRSFLDALLATRVELRFHWHYTPSGCEVSPHCDSKHKLGSHIFYFNSSKDWDPSWGGETLLLDDGGRFHSDSNPDFDDFERVVAAEALDNRSLIFLRKGDSWHGVRELRCPEGRFRKAFIVVFERPDLVSRARRLLSGKRGEKATVGL